MDPDLEVLKLFSCSTQLSMLINVRMPTIFCILIFISMINTAYVSLTALSMKKVLFFSILVFMSN